MHHLFDWMKKPGEGDGQISHNTTPADVQRRLAEGEQLYLLDVREPNEYREAHIPGSVLVPLGNLSMKIADLPKDKPVVAVCRSGNRSGVATSMLRRAGLAQVQNMQGGIIAWARSGGQLKRG